MLLPSGCRISAKKGSHCLGVQSCSHENQQKLDHLSVLCKKLLTIHCFKKKKKAFLYKIVVFQYKIHILPEIINMPVH